MIRCVLYPGSHLFVTTGGKEQAAGIAKEKADELCKLIPGLNNELDLTRGKTKTSKDNIELIFKNGSKLDIMAARQSSRGKRATGGLMEECILIDQTLLNEVIIPTMNVDRRLADGSRHEDETVNKSQIYVTTAGWKNSFAKLRRFIGELKPREPKMGCEYFYLLTLKALKYVTVCQALKFYKEGSETIEST